MRSLPPAQRGGDDLRDVPDPEGELRAVESGPVAAMMFHAAGAGETTSARRGRGSPRRAADEAGERSCWPVMKSGKPQQTSSRAAASLKRLPERGEHERVARTMR